MRGNGDLAQWQNGFVQCLQRVEDYGINPEKIGKLTPGTHIPIVDEKAIDNHPDYYLVLSWNFLEYFVEKYERFLESGGKFIVPNPVIRIVDSSTGKSDTCKAR